MDGTAVLTNTLKMKKTSRECILQANFGGSKILYVTRSHERRSPKSVITARRSMGSRVFRADRASCAHSYWALAERVPAWKHGEVDATAWHKLFEQRVWVFVRVSSLFVYLFYQMLHVSSSSI